MPHPVRCRNYRIRAITTPPRAPVLSTVSTTSASEDHDEAQRARMYVQHIHDAIGITYATVDSLMCWFAGMTLLYSR